MFGDEYTSQDYGVDDLDGAAATWNKILEGIRSRVKRDDLNLSNLSFDTDQAEKLFQQLKIKAPGIIFQEATMIVDSLREIIRFFLKSMRPEQVITDPGFILLYVHIQLSLDNRANSSVDGVRKELQSTRLLLEDLASACHPLDRSKATRFNRFWILSFLRALFERWTSCILFLLDNPPKWEEPHKVASLTSEFTHMANEGYKRMDRARGSLVASSSLSRLSELLLPEWCSCPIAERHRLLGDTKFSMGMSNYFRPATEQTRNGLTILSLCGIGGVGKTELAYQFAKLHVFEYDVVLWVYAETTNSLHRGFRQLGRALRLHLVSTNSRGDPDQDLDAVQEWLRTTEQMGGLPLEVQQMVAIIQFKNLTHNIATFVEKYKRQLHGIHRDDYLNEHTLPTLWKQNFDTIHAQIDPWFILGILSFLNADRIPEDIFYPRDNKLNLPGALAICKDEDDVDDAMDKPKELGLIERYHSSLSLHRLVQTAFLILPDESLDREARQDLFDFASLLVHHAFPKHKGGQPMDVQWEKYLRYRGQVRSLALTFERLNVAKYRLIPSQEFLALVGDCAYYICENDDPRGALKIFDIGIKSHPEREGVHYATLLNTAMMSYFKLNDMDNDSGKKLHDSDEDLAVRYNNFGNLLMEEGSLEEAYAYMQRSLDITSSLPGTEVAQTYVYLCQGWVLFLKGEDHYDEAEEKHQFSEELYVQLGFKGADGYPMTEVNFAWGNLELARGRYEESLGRFKKVLKIEDVDRKRAAVFYKIGDALKNGLRRAKLLREDGQGQEARILRKQAEVLEKSGQDPEVLALSSFPSSEQLRGEAERLRILPRKGDPVTVSDANWEKVYDSL
ncbi:hypothetical protein QBC38DRAFT_514957 [Podospora fimiseda]|uniref:NB-ARC domain-containing protein n=1 Tax=Podospora fimiseda TaxID=252190 RepID=A0AAN7BJF1_9PEZI|nr:hypothetical protein QBC38DRAFT_514957 [Podospora fimiseda]